MTAPVRFPRREIRDAIGLVRILYQARRTGGHAGPDATDPLVHVGLELRAALACADAPESSDALQAGIARAARALKQLEEVITLRDDMGNAARAASARITGQEVSPKGKGGRPER